VLTANPVPSGRLVSLPGKPERQYKQFVADLQIEQQFICFLFAIEIDDATDGFAWKNCVRPQKVRRTRSFFSAAACRMRLAFLAARSAAIGSVVVWELIS
jgi:hypothetical protein